MDTTHDDLVDALANQIHDANPGMFWMDAVRAAEARLAEQPSAEPITFRYDRLSDNTLVGYHAGVVAIVHPPATFVSQPVVRWALAGDGIDIATGPAGETASMSLSCAAAAQAMADHFGVPFAGYETADSWTPEPPHPRDCYPCKGTGRVVGFGAAHGGPCPADHQTEG